jgi:penicillin-insensitive murein endopeptidase
MRLHRRAALITMDIMRLPLQFLAGIITLSTCANAPGSAQQVGDPQARRPVEPVVITDPGVPARDYFGRVGAGSAGASTPVGFYARGCLDGGAELGADGPTWQVMRPSRNRAWGTAALVDFITRVSREVPAETGWPGLLVGDMSQPRGGPMLTGHASHQIGLDADLWLTPMPPYRLSREERETLPATNLVSEDGLKVLPSYTPAHLAFIRLLARQRETERLFVNPAIKKALCRDAGSDRAWLSKVRPMWGHNYHVHVRLACPPGMAQCEAQDKPPQGDGCDASLDWWFTAEALHPKPSKPRPPLTLADLPATCSTVLTK